MKKLSKTHTYFDVDGDGGRDRVGWASGGDGFLVIDRNGDGLITDGSELTFGAENGDARNALEALAVLDNNNDHKIDASDARFGELKLWVDSNRNGTTDAGELKSLTELGIESIGLGAHNLEGGMKIRSNAPLSTAVFTPDLGTTGTVGDTALSFRGMPAPAQPWLGEALSQSLRGLASPDDLVAQMRKIVEGDGVLASDTLGNHIWQYGPKIPLADAVLDTGAGADAAGPAADTGDHQRLLALMAQDMAVFGVRGGEGAFGRQDPRAVPFDFFA